MNKREKLLILLFILLAVLGVVTSFDGSELDDICDQNGQILRRVSGNWICSDPQNFIDYGDIINQTIINVTNNIYQNGLNASVINNGLWLNLTGGTLEPNNTDTQILGIQSTYRPYQGETPTSVSNLFVWYDFTNTSTLTLKGTEITRVDNRQGNANYDLINGTYVYPYNCTSPTSHANGGLNNLGYAEFKAYKGSGQGDCLSTPTTTYRPIYDAIGTGEEATFYIILYENTSVGDSSAESYLGSTKTNQGQGNGISEYGATFYTRVGTGGVNMGYSRPDNTWTLVKAIIDEGDSSMYFGIDKVATSALTFTRDNIPEFIGRTYDAQFSGRFGYMGGNIAEIIVYSSKLTQDNDEKVLAYIENKYGLSYPTLT